MMITVRAIHDRGLFLVAVDSVAITVHLALDRGHGQRVIYRQAPRVGLAPLSGVRSEKRFLRVGRDRSRRSTGHLGNRDRPGVEFHGQIGRPARSDVSRLLRHI